jgi:hypothetical protein
MCVERRKIAHGNPVISEELGGPAVSTLRRVIAKIKLRWSVIG